MPRLTVQSVEQDGDVVVQLTCDPATARDLAYVWSDAHATRPHLAEARPEWIEEVVTILSSACVADLRNGKAPSIPPGDFELHLLGGAR